MMYRFDDFLLDPAARELRRRGELVALPARAFDCLAYLIEHRERAVGRDELIAAVWGRVEISEALLGHTIVKLRRSLGDTSNEQRTIRTVPRFGYRWAQALERVASQEVSDRESFPAAAPFAMLESESDAAPLRATPDHAVHSTAVADSVATVPAASSPRRMRLVAVSLAVALAATVASVVWLSTDRTPAGDRTVAASIAAEAPPATSALVLPAIVAAPDDWRWLRFGLMDLIANSLRSGAVPTAPSETVVSLIKQRGASGDDDPLHDAALARVATLRVQPHVSLEQTRWHVRLDAFGAQRSFSVEAQADDAIAAARAAADALLQKLGHVPDKALAENTSPQLDDLLQRSGAAMLADQLDQARALIVSSAPDLQQQPQIEQRMAQIELRSGEYEAVETRLRALLDRLPAERDSALRARVLITLAAAHVRQHQSDTAFELYEEAIALRSRAADHEVLGVAQLGRGSILAQKGRYEDATAELSRARTELATIGDGLGVASVDVNLGDFQLMRHHPADALPILSGAARQFERLGAREGRAYALSQQMIAEIELLDANAALATSTRFWPPESNTNNLRMRWTLVEARAEALAAAGHDADAAALIERVRAEADPHKDAVVRAQAELLAATIAYRRGDGAAAGVAVTAALLPALRETDPIAWTRGLLLQGRILRAGGQGDRAAAATAALHAWAADAGDDWRVLYATLASAEQARFEQRREPALEQFAQAMSMAERINVPEDLVAVGTSYLDALIEASQLDTARAVSGRIAMWADRDVRAASAQARLFHALGQDEAARAADALAARLAAGGHAVSTADAH